MVGETFDGLLNDINGFHVRAEHLHEALAAAAGGPVEEGTVGGGTGMVCHEFKGGIGTASRVIDEAAGGYTVGVLVQANYGKRDWLRIDGVRVGEAIPTSEVPSPYDQVGRPRSAPPPGSGSIIVVVATDAPLLPHQCERLAQRAGLGIARVGGTGGHTSGDLFIAFATGNRLPANVHDEHPSGLGTYDVRAVGDIVIDRLFDATIEATEEAIVNALVAATTVVGRDGITAHALPHDRLREVMTAQRPMTVRPALRGRRAGHGRDPRRERRADGLAGPAGAGLAVPRSPGRARPSLRRGGRWSSRRVRRLRWASARESTSGS